MKLHKKQDNKPKGETDLCRNRLLKYCRGQGLDLGCGNTKIKSEAIGIDLLSPYADMKIDARLMPFYDNELFDYIFSSHLLEEIQDTEATLREWLRVIKKGGYIVLYQADKDYYYPLDDPRCNQKHIHHFTWNTLWDIFEKIGDVELVHHARYSQEPYNEWSFELVVQKKGEEKKAINGDEGISILIPTLNRPDNIESFATSVDKTTSEPDKVEIVFGIHEDDKGSIKKIEEIKTKLKITVRPVYITRYKDNRIHLSHLWNQIYEKAKYPIVGYFGDDVLFHTEGWDKEIRDEFKEDKAVMVCCNDVHVQKGKAATLFFTHKTVHDKFGFYLPMKFRRWYADTYWDVIYRNAGKYHYRDDIVTEHLHPDVFEEKKDEVYKAMEVFKNADKKIWLSEDNKKELHQHIDTLKNFKTQKVKKVIDSSINNTFHLFWAGSHLSYLRYLTFKTCRLHHPDAQIILHHSSSHTTQTNWVREKQDYESDMGKNYFDSLKDIEVKIQPIDKYKNYLPVYQADFLRWEILRDNGGVYLDTDQIILKNFKDLMECEMFYCAYALEISRMYYPIGVLGSVKNHWISQEMIKRIKENYNPYSYQSIGPDLFRTFMNDSEIVNRVESDANIKNYPKTYFYPAPEPDRYCERMFAGTDIEHKDSYALHWFGGYQPSHYFNAKFTEDFAKTSNDLISKTLRDMGAL